MKDYWTMRDGTEIKYVDMEESHIKNCIAMLQRRIKENRQQEQQELDQFPVFDILDGNAEIQVMISQVYEGSYDKFNEEIDLLQKELERRNC